MSALLLLSAVVFFTLLRFVGGTNDGLEGPWSVGQLPRAADLNTSCAAVVLEPGALCPIGCQLTENMTMCIPCSAEYAACSEFGGCDPLGRRSWGNGSSGNGSSETDGNATGTDAAAVVCTCLVDFVGDRCTLKANFFSVSGAIGSVLIAAMVVFIVSKTCRQRVKGMLAACTGQKGSAQVGGQQVEEAKTPVGTRDQKSAVMECLKGAILPETLRKWLDHEPDRETGSWMAKAYRLKEGNDGEQPDTCFLFKCIALVERRPAAKKIPARQHGFSTNVRYITTIWKITQLGSSAFSFSIPWFETSPIPEVKTCMVHLCCWQWWWWWWWCCCCCCCCIEASCWRVCR